MAYVRRWTRASQLQSIIVPAKYVAPSQGADMIGDVEVEHNGISSLHVSHHLHISPYFVPK